MEDLEAMTGRTGNLEPIEFRSSRDWLRLSKPGEDQFTLHVTLGHVIGTWL